MTVRISNPSAHYNVTKFGSMVPGVILLFSVLMVINVRGAGSGALDLSFGDRGTAVYEHTQFLTSEALVVQPDGKTIVTGFRRNCVSATCTDDVLMVRFNVDGTLDPDFGTNGTVVKDHFGQPESAYAIALQPDGKIVVVGGSTDGSNVLGFKAFRFLPDGDLDLSFGDSGLAYENFDGLGGTATSIIIQDDGKIVVAGCDGVPGLYHASRLYMIRLNADGSLDPTFGTGGRIASDAYDLTESLTVAMQPDGKFVVASMSSPTGTFKLIRLTSSGAPDNDFGTAGVSTSTFISTFRPAIAIQADGKILVSGDYGTSPSLKIPPLRRFNQDGSVDAGFAPSHGQILYGDVCARCTQRVTKIVPLKDGKFFLIGSLDYQLRQELAVSRYSGDGAIDRSFAFEGTSLPRHSNEFTLETAISTLGVTDGALSADGSSIVFTAPFLLRHSFLTTRVSTTVSPASVRGDFDGDRKTDVAVVRPSSQVWYVLNSGDGTFLSTSFGLTGDIPVPADYNFDLKTDYSVARPVNNTWWIWPTPPNGSGLICHAGDIRTPEDFDGDGYADESCFSSNGIWTIRYSSKPPGGGPDGTFAWGLGTDVSVPADYDGDGRADLAVFRPASGIWYIFRTSDEQYSIVQFGVGTDKLVPADYDGDLKTDIAVFREGTWYIQSSSEGSYFGVNWGLAGDVPAPGDYDGDGKYDIAVFRPSEGAWYVLRSSDGGFFSTIFGLSEDVPIPSYSVR